MSINNKLFYKKYILYYYSVIRKHVYTNTTVVTIYR